MSDGSILVVEDDPTLREALCETLELAGYPVRAAADGAAALQVLERQPHGVSMVLSDVQMAPCDGHALLRKVRGEHPDLPVVLMTAYGTIEKAVTAMREGASDYLVKPFDAPALIATVRRFFAPTGVATHSDLVAEDPRTRELITLAERVARADITVMLSGESGTGKEVFARHIHGCSSRRERPFVAINCAAIPENMLEAVLFGYEKGAFTGALQACPGKFEQANGGTLLLDEISEMDLALQAKLLRVLQEREVERLGGRKLIALDVRVLATTNRNLGEEVAAGRFREDLFYRLSVFPLQLPALRERRLDILPLARRLVQRHWCGVGPVPAFTAAAAEHLLSHPWPGNVRELDNVLQRALVLYNGTEIDVADLALGADPTARLTPCAARPDDAGVGAAGLASGGNELVDGLKSREHVLILDALRAVDGRRNEAAERLGISPRTLRYKLARMRAGGVALPA
ncbi:MAG: sigma-54-dependent transcriptional regulator [Porticoccaceae bacterium]